MEKTKKLLGEVDRETKEDKTSKKVPVTAMLRETLIKVADKLDGKGETELADEIDDLIKEL